jgi:DNA-binding MarR family transcriptional regulator
MVRKLKKETGMITFYEPTNNINYDLLTYLDEIGHNSIQFQVLCYLGKHPELKMSFRTMLAALRTPKNTLSNVLTEFIEKGIISMQFMENGLIIYSLTRNQRIRMFVEELAKLDWNETKNLAKLLDLQIEAGFDNKEKDTVFYHLLASV